MSINLERLFDGSPAARNFDLLRSLVPDTGGRELGFRFGTIGAITAASLKTITHGLGKTPVGVFTQASNGGIAFGVDLVDDATFRVANTSATNTTGYWIVIG